MSPSPHTPSTPDARFPEANARINYEPCSNRRTEKRCAAGANGVAEGDGHPYYGRTQDTRRFLYIPLFLSLPVLSRPRFYFFFISASRLCLTSVAKFFRPATIIAPWRSRRWRRKTGFGLRLSCLRIYRDAMHQHVVRNVKAFGKITSWVKDQVMFLLSLNHRSLFLKKNKNRTRNKNVRVSVILERL